MSRIKKRKYIKDKYFEKSSVDPTYYSPKEKYKIFMLSPFTLGTVIDLIIDILEQENWDGVNWVKN